MPTLKTPPTRGRPVYIEPAKHQALKRYAVRRGRLLSAVVDEAIASYIRRKRIPTEPSPVA